MILLDQEPEGCVSASQIKTWESCRKAWAYRYLEGIKAPEKESQSLGKRVHAVLEAWLKEGTLPDPHEIFMTSHGKRFPGKIAQAGICFLPPPRTVEVEFKFALQIEDVFFRGFVDVLGPDFVIDHKTTTDFQWVLPAEILEGDAQAVIYAAVARARGCLSPRAKWIYYLTHGTPKALPVETSMEKFEEYLPRILKTAREIREAKNEKTAEAFEGNLETCSAFGGCYYRDTCKPNQTERIFKAMSFDTTKFIEAQKARLQQTKVEPPPLPEEEEKKEEEKPKSKAKTKSQVKSPEKLIRVLYLDCYPMGGPRPTMLSSLVVEAQKQLCTEAGDYRLEPDLAYGRAAGALSSVVASLVEPGSEIVASARSAEERDCLSWLCGNAEQVIRAF